MTYQHNEAPEPLASDEGVIQSDDAECRKAWARHAAKQHSWLNNSFPPMRDGRFDCGHHESEYQTFLAGVRHGRS
jgi:hypothetical protein